jgi:ABC-type antimicrobial peptide transport system permease subunit
MQLLALFAAVALFLGAIGIYGVLTEWVGQRTRDIGVRIALGASGGAVVRLVVFRGAMLAFVGALVGMVVALAITRSLERLLYQVSAVDPAAFIIAPLALLGVAIVASYIPARRAARIDPVIALRNS